MTTIDSIKETIAILLSFFSTLVFSPVLYICQILFHHALKFSRQIGKLVDDVSNDLVKAWSIKESTELDSRIDEFFDDIRNAIEVHGTKETK